MPQHRHQEGIRFLKRIDAEMPAETELRLIVNNYGTHKRPRVKSWLRRRPRVHLHFTPTSSSWLNLVKRCFRNLTQQRIRRGSFHVVKKLITTIEDYIENHNQKLQVFEYLSEVLRLSASRTRLPKRKEALEAVR